jgi:D-alanyl-D-alanine carboxypeptidase
MVQRNYNTLLGRYPGANGMKTGFICASGFNLVASASRDGKRLIAVVLGAPSSAARAMKAAQLLERGFNSSSGLTWLMPTAGTVEAVRPIDVTPPNLRDQMCGPHRKRPAAENEDDFIAGNSGPDSPYAVFLSSLRGSPTTAKAGAALLQDVKLGEPVLVFTGTKPPAPGAQAAIEKKKTVAAKPSNAKDAPAAAASSGEAAASKPKPKPPAPRDTAKVGAPATATVAAPGDAVATKPKPKPAAPASTVAATPTGDAATTKPKPKPPATAAAPPSGDAAPKPKPKPPAPKAAPISLTPAAQPTQQSSQAR